ncbi:MAG TPA: PKD domain-containing protein [Bacteroidales bacterium]|nr:PKD domain-containing protein [Bacteroidales bacterium]
MKKITILIISFALLLLSSNLFSQQSYGGLPISFTNKSLTQEIDRVVISPPDMISILAEVELFEKNGQIYKIAELIPTDITMDNSGTWDILGDGTKIWRLCISSKEAKGLALYYKDFYLPLHTQLYLYNNNRKQLIGSFDYRNNPTMFPDFSTEIIQGDKVYLELIQTPEATEDANIHIYEISYIFRGVEHLVGRYEDEKTPGGVGSSEGCEVNINCPEGTNWQTQKKGVAEYFTGSGLCTGTIVNNTSNDGTPYFLTADHCGGSGTNFTGWQFYFNYEASGCTDPGSEPAYNTVTGATKRARGDQNTGSDFLLLELNTTEATLAGYNAYYNGWDKGTTASPSGVSIHHPAGDIKKISTYSATLTSGTFGSCPANAHWLAQWVSTVTDWGVTEGGSSGSPLFNNNKLVVGTLSGGSSYCGAPLSSANDLYGKFSYHWESNGGTAAVQLKPWLDPGNTGATTCNGYDPNATGDAPVADFIGDPTTVAVGGTVDFTDLSTNTPTSWSWTFAGGTPGTSTTQNPSVVYNTAGTYDVTLVATNGDGSDTETKSLYIEVTESNIPVADFIGNPTTVVEGGTVDFTDLSTNNPTSWSWTFAGGTPGTSTAQNPSIVYNTAGTYDVTLVATNGDGSDTETKTLYIEVVADGTVAADFTGNPTTLTEGGNVDFTDESLGDITSWNWAFEGGNPATSTNQNPTINYPAAGIYSVTLTVSDGTNSDDAIKVDYIIVNPLSGELQAAFVASSYNITAGDCINFNDQSTGTPTSWSWSFPGAETLTSSNQHPTNICYETPGIYDVILQVQNSTEQDTYICEDCITVNPDPSVPIADFEANITTIPVGGVVHFTNLSQNGPFNQWSWSFEGGTPTEFNDSTPPPIAYMQVGLYDVELRCRKTNSVQDIEVKHDYIKVIPAGTVSPVADFTANYTVIEPGESINFIDLSSGNPYHWSWQFPGAVTTTSDQQNPLGIQYNDEGEFTVTLTVSNNLGEDTMTKELYIKVSEEDPCVTAPSVAFDANPRLIAAGQSVQFENLSTGYPTYHTWSFPGGTPSYSNEGSPTNPIIYSTPGIYDVTLTVNNGCGASYITKENYIYVFSGNVQSYCDTLTTINPGEVVEARIPEGTWGFLAGHNGLTIKEYANLYEDHTFSQVKAVLVPVIHANYGAYSSKVRFYVSDGNYPTPDTILGYKDVYIRDLVANQTNLVTFSNPIEIDGPFYVGYKITYVDGNSDGYSDDMFVIGMAAPRANVPENNQMYLKKSNVWYTCNEYFNFSSALPLRPISCLVDVEQLIAENSVNVYPNPSTGFVNIQINDESVSNFNIEIYDALGRKIINEFSDNGPNEYIADLSSYPEGLYIIRISFGERIVNKKLLLSK